MKKNNYKIYILITLIIGSLILLRQILSNYKKPTITIWIHGTGPKGILPKSIAKFTNQQVKSFIYVEPGLKHASSLPNNYHHYKIAQVLSSKDPEQFSFQWFYLFGWSGKLSPEARKQAAKRLLEELKNLINKYRRSYYSRPSIRIITHSHGGNVALNLSQIKNIDSLPIVIDELILLACPIQKETKNNILSSMFKNIYSIHSHLDTIQILDPQGWPTYKKTIIKAFHAPSIKKGINKLKKLKNKPLFSERHFPNNSKVIQVRYKTKSRDITHIEFILLPFIKKLPIILKQIKGKNKKNNTTELIINL